MTVFPLLMLQLCTFGRLFELGGEFSDDFSFGGSVFSENMLSIALEEFVPEWLIWGAE